MLFRCDSRPFDFIPPDSHRVFVVCPQSRLFNHHQLDMDHLQRPVRITPAATSF